ncbi:ChaB family protein [Pseudonocardia lacus]|uniref:ChaB family protein n=1 Tax=Pseudonocardia lacus TaxID=2835865 RepID=UPI00202993A6|nr:ChaB family protein [Pseudonocardia lacus]
MARTKKQETERMREDVPSTIARSDDKAVRTYKKTLESAEESYPDDPERAHRAAFSSLKHTHEKVGDHWEPKEEYGPSDDQAATPAPRNRRSTKDTAEGVNARASKAHLVEVAEEVGVTSAAKHTKAELVEEIRKANARETAKAREREKG